MVKKADKKLMVCCNDMCFDGTYIWFVHYNLNILFCVDLENACVRKTYLIPYEEYYGEYELYIRIIVYGDFLWLIPGLANRIVIFNKKTEQFKAIDMLRKKEWKGDGFFSGAYQYKHFLYCIPAAFLKLIRINLKTREIVCLKDFSVYGERYNLFGYNTAKGKQNTIVKPLMDGKDLIVIDLEKEKVCLLETNVDDLNFSGTGIEIACIDNFVYMCSFLKEDLFLRKIDLNTGNVIKKIKIDYGIRKLSSVADYIVLDYDRVSKYQIYNKEMELIHGGEIKINKTLNLFKNERQQGTWKDFDNGMIGCFHNGENLLYIYRTLDMKLEKVIDIQVDISCLEKLKGRIKREDGLKQKEHNLYTLSDFLYEDMKKTDAMNGTETVGKKIFKAIT